MRKNFPRLIRFARSQLKPHPGQDSIAMKRRGYDWSDNPSPEGFVGADRGIDTESRSEIAFAPLLPRFVHFSRSHRQLHLYAYPSTCGDRRVFWGNGLFTVEPLVGAVGRDSYA